MEHTESTNARPKLTIPQLLQKLDDLYEKEEGLIKEMNRLKAIYEQVQEDKELLQMMIMHQSNKAHRTRPYMKND